MNGLFVKISLSIFVFMSGPVLSSAYADEPVSVPVINDLQQFSAKARSRNMPMLVLFSIEDCQFCEVIRSEYLTPMLNREDDRQQMLIGEIVIENYNYVRDFSGESFSADNLGMKYSIDFSPTLVFFDAHGNELAERMIGFKGRDYYDLDLDNAIAQSIKKFSQ